MDEAFPLPELPPEMTIDMWSIELDRPLDLAVNLDQFLSEEACARAEQFVFARDAFRFQLCRAMLRMGLAWYLQKTPREIALTTRQRDKPCLVERSGLFFNVTHAGGLALIAFTTVGEVGIDIEPAHRKLEALDVAFANFTSTKRQ